MHDSSEDPALALCFVVKIDGHDIGSFTACEGLTCEFEILSREEGGNNDFVHKLVGRRKYGNVKLTRPINSDSEKLSDWIAKLGQGEAIRRTTAQISAHRADGEVVTKWDLDGVIPVRWTGPSMSVETNKVATETFELAHHGFLSGT